jgi:DNA-binding IclR family transcriptional regulator
MKRLATDLDLECEASAAVADEMVALARAGPRRPGWSGPAVGQRLPLVAPVGAVFTAWAAPAAVGGWLAHAGERERARYRRYLDAVRARGYSVTLRVAAERPVGRALARLTDEPGTGIGRDALAQLVGDLGHDDYQLVETDDAAAYAVTSIAAPVFGPHGEVALALALLGFRGSLTGAEVRAYGERIRDSALLVTRETHGRPDAALAGAFSQGG